MDTPRYRRICVQRSGYAVVPGDTDEEALANARSLGERDFDWEPVGPDLIGATAEIVEACGPDGSVPG